MPGQLERPEGSDETKESAGPEHGGVDNRTVFIDADCQQGFVETSSMNGFSAKQRLVRPGADPAPALPTGCQKGDGRRRPTNMRGRHREHLPRSCYALPPHGKGKTTQASRPPQ